MGEIKQTNFRIDSERADAFRAFCEKQGMNQAQGFDHLMQVLEMNTAKIAVPGRVVEIESFEYHANALISAYLNSIELMQSTEERVREEFQKMLMSKDEQILELQEKSKKKDKIIEDIRQQAEVAREKQLQAEKEAEDAKLKQATAQQIAADKTSIADMLVVKLSEAENKLAEYPKMKETEASLRKELANSLQTIKDNQKDAEIAQERAVAIVQKTMDKKLSDLQAEMTGMRTSIDEKREQINKLEDKNEKLREMITELQIKNAELLMKNKKLGILNEDE